MHTTDISIWKHEHNFSGDATALKGIKGSWTFQLENKTMPKNAMIYIMEVCNES